MAIVIYHDKNRKQFLFPKLKETKITFLQAIIAPPNFWTKGNYF